MYLLIRSALALILGALCLISTALSQSYTVIDLGTLGGDYSAATAINNRSQVAGYSYLSDGSYRAFLYSHGAMLDLGTLGGVYSEAAGVNDAGMVIGTSSVADNAANHAFLYTAAHMMDLGTLPGSNDSNGTAINNAGQIVGYASSPHDPVGFLYSGGGLSPLPHAGFDFVDPEGINAAGQITGTAVASNPFKQHAFLLSGGVLKDLGALADGIGDGVAINSSGQVAGFSDNNQYNSHAVLWSNGAAKDLGVLPGFSVSYGHGIDSMGQVTGYSSMQTSPHAQHAILYNAIHGMVDLNDEIPKQSGWVLQDAAAINDQGYIVGGGLIAGQEHAFLLRPNPVLILKKNIFAVTKGDPGCEVCRALLDPVANSLPPTLQGLSPAQRKATLARVQSLAPALRSLARTRAVSRDITSLLMHQTEEVLSILRTSATSETTLRP